MRERGGATRWTKALRQSLFDQIEAAAEEIALTTDISTIAQRFIDEDFVGAQRKLRAIWRERRAAKS